MLLRLAWRNLWRQRARTLILISAITFSYTLLLVAMGLGDDSHQQMLDAGIEGAGGSVLIHHEGYWETLAGDLVIQDGLEVVRQASEVEGVAVAIPRIRTPSLAGTSAGARALELIAIDPALEARLADPHEHLTEGERLDETELRNPVLLGVGLIEALEIEVGDRVVLTASRPDGELTRGLFRVAGFLDSGLGQIDEGVAFTTLDAARGMLESPEIVTQVGIVLVGGALEGEVAEALRRVLRVSEPLEVLTWREALPEMVGYIETDDAFLYIYVAVMFVVVAFSIANTFLVAVTERIREFGLLNALGLRSGRLGALVLAETAVLTVVSLAVGLALGLLAHTVISSYGIPVATWGVSEMELAGLDISDMVIRSKIQPMKWAVATVAVMVTTVGSAIFAAVRAARLLPAEAMRFYE